MPAVADCAYTPSMRETIDSHTGMAVGKSRRELKSSTSLGEEATTGRNSIAITPHHLTPRKRDIVQIRGAPAGPKKVIET